jgi:hypothetical protein
MVKQAPFTLVYADEVKQHLRSIDAKFHSWIGREIETQLRFEPDVETKNRKPLVRPVEFGAQWELRLGPDNRFRVYYSIDRELRSVRNLPIGMKDRNRLWFGGEEFVG